MCDCEKKSSDFLTGIVLGALAGAGLFYFLTSTKEGKKIKDQLVERGDDVLDELQDLMADLEEKSAEFKEKAAAVEEELADKMDTGSIAIFLLKIRLHSRKNSRVNRSG